MSNQLSAVEIVNRADCCQARLTAARVARLALQVLTPPAPQDRLAQFQILAGNVPGPAQGVSGTAALSFNPACFVQNITTLLGAAGYFPCALTGRYVTLQQTLDGRASDSPSSPMNLCSVVRLPGGGQELRMGSALRSPDELFSPAAAPSWCTATHCHRRPARRSRRRPAPTHRRRRRRRRRRRC